MTDFNIPRAINHTVTDQPSAIKALRDHVRFARYGALPPWEQDRYEEEWAEAFVKRVAALATDGASGGKG